MSMDACQTWNRRLAERLIAGLPDSRLMAEWGESDGSSTDPRAALVCWADDDADVRDWLQSAWRDAHPEVVDVVESTQPEALAADCEVLLRQFSADELLLALLTDGEEDGFVLAGKFIAELADNGRRQLFNEKLEALAADKTAGVDDPCPAARHGSVVVFGGHPRDPSKLQNRLPHLARLDVRWKFQDVNQRTARMAQQIAGTLRGADAAVVVTGMIGHVLAETIKRQAQSCEVPCAFITKATDQQLSSALSDLFPAVRLTG